MNQAGLQDIQIMLADLEIHNWITGPNCDKSWYLNIRKEKEFLNFTKKPSRKGWNKKEALEGPRV